MAFGRLDFSSFSLRIPEDELKLKPINIGGVESTKTTTVSQEFNPKAANTSDKSGVAAGFRIVDLLLGVWLLGVAILTGMVLRANIKLWRALKRDKKLSSETALNLFEQCKKDLGTNVSIDVIETSQVTTPALFGFLRPRLLLPIGFAKSLSREALRHIFLHELAHIKRRDAFVGWVMNALQILHWFNPLVWLAFARMRSDRELATDGLALSILNQDEPKQYGRTIIQMLELFSKPGRLPAMTGVLEQNSQVKRRIEMISEFKKNSYKWSPVAVAILVAVGCMSLPDADLESKSAVQPVAQGSGAAAVQEVKEGQESCIPDDLAKSLLSCEFLNEPGEKPKSGTKECDNKYIKTTWDEATNLHLEAVGSETTPGTKDKSTIEKTLQMYAELENCSNLEEPIEGFDDKTRPTHYRIAYYRAELLWIMEDWAKCGPAFDTVVAMDPKGVYRADAAYASLLCYNKIYVEQTSDKSAKCKERCKGEDNKECMAECERVQSKSFKARELTKMDKGILNSYKRYICFVSKGENLEDLIKVKYPRARIYYEANHFAEAAVLFKDIAMNHSDDETGVFAANLYLDCLNVLGSMVGDASNPECYVNLAEAVDVFIDTSKKPGQNLMKDEEFAVQIKELKASMDKHIEELNNRRCKSRGFGRLHDKQRRCGKLLGGGGARLDLS